MKISGGQADGLLAAPPATLSAILLYGPDEGLVRERAEAAVKAVLGGNTDDPFRLTVLDADALKADDARLADEAMAQSLVGGRRVLRLRSAGDTLAKPLGLLLAQGATAALIVIEAGDLPSRSSLRKLGETMPGMAAIACYADGPKELAQLVRSELGARRVRADDEATQYLVANLGGDRGVTRQELEKLCLAVGDGGRVGLAEAMASIGDGRALDLEEAVYDAFEGRTSHAEAILDRLFGEGETPVGVIRALQRHAQRLHLAAARVAAGQPADEVVKSLRLFFRYEPRFRSQLKSCEPARLDRQLRVLTAAEFDLKSTGPPDQAVCRRALYALAPRSTGQRAE